MSITDIGKEAADATSDDGGSSTASADEYERVDVSDMDFVKVHPGPTAIEGRVTGLRYLPPAPDDAGNYDDDARGMGSLILEGATIPDDDDFESVAIFESTTDTGDDFKVVNTEDDSIDVYDAGVSVGQMFESDEVDDIDTDEVVLKMSTSAGRSVIRTLDVRGLANADVVRNDDYEPDIQSNGFPTTNDALIEKHPDNDDDTYVQPRYSRDPQLRPDVEGERVVVLVQHLANVQEDYDGNSHWATVLADLDEERTQELAEMYADDPYYESDDPDSFIHEVGGDEMIRLAPTMEFEPDEDLLRATQWMEWNWPDEDRIEELAEKQGVER